MVTIPLSLAEEDLVKLILEFLESRGLHISQTSLERETGIINGLYSEDTLFLRQLVLDGQWDSALDFIEPLAKLPEFKERQFRYLVTKYKYYELLCVKQEPGPMQNNDFTVEEVVECLKDLEELCPTPEDYRHLCALLTLPRLSDHADFKQWNPSSARAECFQKVYPLISKFLPPEKTLPQSMTGSHLGQPIGASINDRFIQLVAKGLFYESCVDFCQGKAVRDKDSTACVKIPTVLEARNKLGTPDVSLVSWLESLATDQFSLPFEQKGLDMKLDRLRKPELDATWTETILANPIKPQIFPHSAVPNVRLKSAEKMSQSMMPRIDGLNSMVGLMSNSTMVMGEGARAKLSSAMSQSMAPGFQIRPSPPTHAQGAAAAMQQSQLDLLFETSDLTRSTMGCLPEQGNNVGGPVGGSPGQPMAGPQHEMSPREQLEEIKRRNLSAGAGGGSQVPVPTRAQSVQPQMETSMSGGGRLFHEFSSRHPTRMMTASQYRASSEPPFGTQVESLNYGMMQTSINYGTGMPSSSSTTSTSNLSPAHRPTSVSSGRLPVVNENDVPYPNPYSQPSMSSHQHRPSSSAAANDYAPAAIKRTPRTTPSTQNGGGGSLKNVQFVAISRLEDAQAIRAAAFHPSGRYFVVGTNSKQMHICRYPDVKRIREDHVARAPEIMLTRPKQHRGSVYCASFNPTGELIATGSNDKTVRLMSFNADNCKIGAEMELAMHDGTVRDTIFMEDTTNRTSLLISGGAGNCWINVTDCSTGTTFRSLQGHTAPILGMYAFGGCTFISCSQDKTIRFWDLRCPQAVNLIAPSSPVTSVCCDPSGRLLVSGHEDASIMLYDVTGSRVLQLYRPHGDEVRAVRFSPGTYYLLSASYDKKVAITDMRGDLMSPLLYLPVAEHHDKVIQCRWHPHDFTFLSTSADRSAVLWALPPPSNPY